MKKCKLISLIVAGSLILTGSMILIVSSIINKVSNKGETNYFLEEIKNEKTISESFDNINIDLSQYSINILKSTNDTCLVHSIDREKYYINTEVKDNTLYVTNVNELPFFDR